MTNWLLWLSMCVECYYWHCLLFNFWLNATQIGISGLTAYFGNGTFRRRSVSAAVFCWIVHKILDFFAKFVAHFGEIWWTFFKKKMVLIRYINIADSICSGSQLHSRRHKGPVTPPPRNKKRENCRPIKTQQLADFIYRNEKTWRFSRSAAHRFFATEKNINESAWSSIT